MNILQAVVRTLRQPDGTYSLPDGNRIVHRPCIASGDQWWTVCCIADGIEYWLTHALTWECLQTWPNYLWGPDFGFTTPEEAYFAWLNWVDRLEEG